MRLAPEWFVALALVACGGDKDGDSSAVDSAPIEDGGDGGDGGDGSGGDGSGGDGGDGGGDGGDGGDGGGDGGDGGDGSGGDGGDGGHDSAGKYNPDCEDVYTWEAVGAPFVYTWCSGCHSSLLESPAGDTGWDPRQGAPESLNFDSLEAVCGQISLIWGAVDGARMPPTGGPPQEEIDALEAWINCGPSECQ